MSDHPTSDRLLAQPGTFVSRNGCRCSVVAEADSVRLRLTHFGSLEMITVDCHRDDQDPLLWHAEVDGDRHGWSYSYELDREGKTLARITDPWAQLVREGRGILIREETEVTPRPPLDPADAIVYELHTRDFTRHRSSGLPWNIRGTYPGLAHRGSTLEGSELPTGLDHILDLGVNVIQLMPVHSFSMPYSPQYEWGYMPLFFNAPQDTYASSVDLCAPVTELKQTVSALHEAGLRVTLDVVYNHTAESWPDHVRSLMALAPKTYFRFRKDGTPYNGSACGNEFFSDSEHGRRFVVDSVKHWVTTYGVDGFRFDLMGLIDEETMALLAKELHAIDPTIMVYGEPWAAGETPISVNHKGKQQNRGWGAFNDDFRNALRGDVFEVRELGFLGSGRHTEAVKTGIRGSVDTFAANPPETLNYIECHDNHTLSDRLALA
ncbi:MAG: alpha-amylase family glycosyl hydrolase, partial [Planctomycetota bacterium]